MCRYLRWISVWVNQALAQMRCHLKLAQPRLPMTPWWSGEPGILDSGRIVWLIVVTWLGRYQDMDLASVVSKEPRSCNSGEARLSKLLVEDLYSKLDWKTACCPWTCMGHSGNAMPLLSLEQPRSKIRNLRRFAEIVGPLPVVACSPALLLVARLFLAQRVAIHVRLALLDSLADRIVDCA